ncbi:MAG TPA: zf-HC2 domain-containing protein [Anaerolineales bacterium]|jgi:anti-sigma factor RsiW|nr:zf-HC2 domain-containing protein [Anaerolineales bacterium]
MKCEQVQSLLVAYLDGEVTPSERTLIQAHLSNCTVCQQELNLLSTARSRVRSMLQRRAVHAAPSAEAWNRLEARLTHKAPSVKHVSNPYKKFGGVPMKKRSILSAITSVAVLVMLAVFVARNVTPVSAREILDRAYKAQTQAAPANGIEHVRDEGYSNLEGKPDGQGMDSIIESYSDPASGKYRVVMTDAQTGMLQAVYAFDGSNAYAMEGVKGGQNSLTVYRVSQNRPSLQGTTFSDRINGKSNAALDAKAKDMFDKMRQDPQVKLIDQETWKNGHMVYVLQSQQVVKWLDGNEVAQPMGLVTLYFDVKTYQLLGSRVTVEKGGREIVISRQQILLDEVLPADSPIAWDLSDVQGVNIVDDKNGEHAQPEVISVGALAMRIPSAYLLRTVPDGFSLELNALPKQFTNLSGNGPFFYEATYTNQAGDYFTIRAFDNKKLEDTSWAYERYTTASGLTLYFVNQPSADIREFNGGLMEAPNGHTYAIESSLPRATIKEWLENLVPVK